LETVIRLFHVVSSAPPKRPLAPVTFESTSRRAEIAGSGPNHTRNSPCGATDGTWVSPTNSPPMKTCARPGSSWNALAFLSVPRR
jgi:hypothetical protein